MKISLVMTTYNGSKYILDQLVSLKDQSRGLDEVLIYDDCSSDDTVLIVENFIKLWKLQNWVIVENKKNLGWRVNFHNAIINASGDYIFLCDQDDIWNKSKIEEMTSILEQNKDILLLASNYKQKVENGKTSIYNDNFTNDKSILKLIKNQQLLNILRPGCTYCFRKEIVPYFRKTWCSSFAHDALLWRIAFCLGGLYIYNSPLITFRRHDNNSTPVFRKTQSLRKIYRLLKSLSFIYFDAKLKQYNKFNETKTTYENCVKFVLLRLIFLRKFNICAMIKLLGKYKYYNVFPREYLSDIYHSAFRR